MKVDLGHPANTSAYSDAVPLLPSSQKPVIVTEQVPWLLVFDRSAVAREAEQLVKEARSTIEPLLRGKREFGLTTTIRSMLSGDHNCEFSKKMQSLFLSRDTIGFEASNIVSGGFNAERLHSLFTAGLIEKLYREKVAHYELSGFERVLERERLQRGLQLTALEGLVKEGGELFDANHLFITHGILRNRVLITSPLVMEDVFHGTSIAKDDVRSPWLVQFSDIISSDFDGYSHRFGMAKLEVESEARLNGEDKGVRSVLKPIVCIDPKIFRSLQEFLHIGKVEGDLTQPQLKTAHLVMHVFREIQTFTLLGGHDYIHHMIYDPSLTGAYSFSGPQPPSEKLSPLQTGFEEWKDALKRTHIEKRMTPLEGFSHLLHRDVWNKIFSERPQVKERIVERAARYLESLGELKDALTAKHGEYEAGRMTRYLAKVVMTELNLIISMDDEIVRKPLPRCDNTSLVEAVEKLNLPSYNPLPKIRQVLAIFYPNDFSRSATDRQILDELTSKRISIELGEHQAALNRIRDIYEARQAVGKQGLDLKGFEAMQAMLAFEGFRGSWAHAYVRSKREASAPEVAGKFYREFVRSGAAELDSVVAAKDTYVRAVTSRPKK